MSSAVVAVEIAPAAQHSARAKHCKAKCRKAKATRYLAGHRYSYFAGSSYGSGESLELDLCADGTLDASGTQWIYRTGAYDFTFDGRWSVISAKGWRARVAFTTADYQANNPFYIQPDPPPAAGVLRLWIKARRALGLRDGGGLFDPLQGPLSRTGLPTGSCPVVGAPGA